MLPPSAHSSARQDQSNEDDEDVEMGGPETTSPTTSHTPLANAHQPSLSPAILPQDSRSRQNSYSSVTHSQRHYSFSHSTSASPALHPRTYDYTRSSPGSALTSPALLPQRDVDQEATAALLMLNTDRRGTISGGRGLSVKDLLST